MGKIRLHIKLDITSDSDENISILDQILYQLVFCRCIPMGNGYLFLDQVEGFDFEISNTVKEKFLQNNTLSFVSFF
jgi:hypothetical protein